MAANLPSTVVLIISFAGKGSFDVDFFIASTHYEGPVGALWVVISFVIIFLGLTRSWGIVGASVRSSAAQDIKHLLGSFNTYATALSYVFSAWVFMLLYMMTSNDNDQLGITIEQRYKLSGS